ncbi:Innexin inx2 [Araneus ventricosus]|uniref:Innexin n=1 Tax=Araneus ventricosus TaxID=182803 RepID=A0A4Y2KGN3_ARAVE|nr:Innexin inx2 [Araneus ventricosus]
MTISIPLSIVLFVFGIIGFMIPFRKGVITSPFIAIIDNRIFRLHYRLTFGFLLAFAIFLAATTLLEEPIDQILDGDRVWELLDRSCLVNNEFNLSEVGLGNAFEQSLGLNETIYDRKPALMFYYQVLTLSLFVQAFICLIPFKLWVALESGITQSMLDIFYSCRQKTEKVATTGREILASHLLTTFNTIPDGWFYGLVTAEALNLMNVVGQIFLVNSMFNGYFFGDQNLPLFRANLSNWAVECNHVVHLPMSALETKCFFEYETAPVDIRHFDATCNFVRTGMDEKFYMFITFWLFYIAALSGSVLVCRFLIIFSPRVRSFWTRSRVLLSNPDCYQFIFRKSTIADWFLFDMLCKNLEPDDFNDLVNDFAKKLEGKKFRIPIDNYI